MRGHSPRKRRARAYSPKPTGRRCAAWCAACALRERSEPTRARRLLAEGGSARSCSCGAGARVRGVLGALQVVVEDCSSAKGMSPDGEGEEQTGAEIRSHTGHTLAHLACLGPRARPSARAPRARRGEAWPRPTPGAAARLGRSGLGQGSGIAPPHHTNRARLTPSDRATLLSPGAQGVFFFAVRRSISRDCRGRPPSGACIPGTWRRSLARQYCKHRRQRGCRYPGAQFRLFHPSSLLGPPTVGQRGVGWLGQNLQAGRRGRQVGCRM